MVLDKQPTNIH